MALITVTESGRLFMVLNQYKDERINQKDARNVVAYADDMLRLPV
jgi:hypothetical protein